MKNNPEHNSSDQPLYDYESGSRKRDVRHLEFREYERLGKFKAQFQPTPKWVNDAIVDSIHETGHDLRYVPQFIVKDKLPSSDWRLVFGDVSDASGWHIVPNEPLIGEELGGEVTEGDQLPHVVKLQDGEISAEPPVTVFDYIGRVHAFSRLPDFQHQTEVRLPTGAELWHLIRSDVGSHDSLAFFGEVLVLNNMDNKSVPVSVNVIGDEITDPTEHDFGDEYRGMVLPMRKIV